MIEMMRLSIPTYIQAGHVVLQHGSFSLSRLKKKKKKMDCGILPDYY